MPKRKRKPSRVPGIYKEPQGEKTRCVACRLHAARLDAAALARYQPPLGTRFRVKANSGGHVLICPYCTPLDLGDGRKTTLHEKGIVNQEQASRLPALNV